MIVAEPVRLGATDVRVTRLSLGCAPIANLYTELGDAEAGATVDAAWAAGLRFFDTAPLYGNGLSETRLGAALVGRDRDDAVVATKVGRLLEPGAASETIFEGVPALHAVFDFSYDGVMRSLEASLGRLGLDRVDVVHVHDPDDHAAEALAGAFPALRKLRDEKVIGAVGAGMNQSEVLARFVREAGVDCVLVAGRYTLLDQSAADELLPLCDQHGVAVIAAGVFNSGVLADPRPGAYFDYAPASDAVLGQAQAMARVCEAHGVPLRAAVLQFPLQHPAVTTVLMGARTADEVRQNVAAFEHPIPDELWEALATQTHSK
jgi:D-threo-aldose 1-dehydrogenase